MTKKLCVCLTKRSTQDCIEFVSSSDADLVEHRMDFMTQVVGLKDIYSMTDTPIIATCRSQEMGGNFEGNESLRISHLLEAIDCGASFVDLEIETEHVFKKQIFKAVSESNCQLIISKHYTNLTPEYKDLLDLVTRMKDERADIMKVVVTPESISDCRRVLQLYSEDLDTHLIAFALGNMGKFTRVSALFLGAPFMYVSQDSGQEAASGQITLSDMRTIVRSLS